MKTHTIASALFAAAAACPAAAASPFDGTWKTDLKSVRFDPKPDEYLLAMGSYTCKTCMPPLTVPADGKFHAVTGHDYYDAAAVRIDGPHRITAMRRRGSKLVSTAVLTVSPDGKTLTYTGTGVSDTGVKSSSTSTATRVAAAPAGAHAVSGSWKAAAVQSASQTGMLQTIRVVGGTVAFSVPTGESYTARLGGPAVVQKNDPAKTMIQVRQLGPNHIVEEDSRHGKLVYVYDMMVAPDGRTMTIATTDKRDNTTTRATLLKQ